jgi:hypothetical protein
VEDARRLGQIIACAIVAVVKVAMSVPSHINFLLHIYLVHTLLNSSAFVLHLDL